jgi:SAM-dependent methyltransferase
MNRDDLVETWRFEEQQPFSGWDFSYLEGRMIEEQPPWSYLSRSAELMRWAASVVDMGTGGSERLLKLRGHWPERVVVTEGYAPSVKLAAKRLSPFGVQVVDVPLSDDGSMPFADDEFDLVLNRHSGFSAREVARILVPGGSLLTQQIHGSWAHDLLAVFGAEPQWPDSTLEMYVPRLQAAGLTIVNAQDWSGQMSFADVGAIVYYLGAVPWLVPGFSVATHSEQLLLLHSRLEKGDSLTFVAAKYPIEARKVETHA